MNPTQPTLPAPFTPETLRGLPLQPIFGHIVPFMKDPLGFFTRCAREHGDLVPMTFFGLTEYLVSHPDLVEQILATHHRSYVKPAVFQRPVSRQIFGNGLVASEGDFWLKQRRLAQPAFHRERVDGYARTMVEFTRQLLADWRPGEARDVHADMMRLTLKIAVKTLFDQELGDRADRIGSSFERVVEEYARAEFGVFSILEGKVPTPSSIRRHRPIALLNREIQRVIQERRTSAEDRGDLLSMLMSVRDDEDRGMSDRQLRDEVMTFFVAGHETTALALSWAFYLLGGDPSVRLRVDQEIASVLGDRLPCADDVERLPLCRAVIHESMRLYPPVWAMGRAAGEQVRLGNHTFPATTQFYMSQWVIQRDERFWPRADKFLPDRWLDGSEALRPRFAYFPFGGGPRRCIGQAFGLMEAVLILATVAREFRLQPLVGLEPRPRALLTLRPDGGVRVRVERPLTVANNGSGKGPGRQSPD